MNYAFTNGKILNGTKDMQIQTGLCILVRDGKIYDIIKDTADLDGYKIIDLQGHYILPGLINMHVHLAGSGKPQKKQRDNEKLVNTIMGSALTRAIAYNMVAGFAKDELLSGVTTIRTVGDLGNFDTRLRDEIEAGTKMGPRILAANQGISVPGGHMAGSVAIAAANIDEALAHLNKCEKEKVDIIKLMITGGVLDAKEKGVPGELKMSPDMVSAVCDKAHADGYMVSAHVESPEGVRVALENGVDSIEHGAKMDDDMIRLFKERGAFLCTTISPALPYALFDRTLTNATEVEQYMEMSYLRESLTVQRQPWQMTSLLYWEMTSAVHGSHSMTSGVSYTTSTNTSGYPTHLHCTPRQSGVQSLPGLDSSPDPSRRANMQT